MTVGYSTSHERAEVDEQRVRASARVQTLEQVSDWVRTMQERISFQASRLERRTRSLLRWTIFSIALAIVGTIFLNVFAVRELYNQIDQHDKLLRQQQSQVDSMSKQVDELSAQVAMLRNAVDVGNKNLSSPSGSVKK